MLLRTRRLCGFDRCVVSHWRMKVGARLCERSWIIDLLSAMASCVDKEVIDAGLWRSFIVLDLCRSQWYT